MAGVSLKHICKSYPNGFEAVKDFNLEIEEGEVVAFVGPSGCGKSTVLRMIAGLETVNAGEVRIGDAIVTDADPKERDIAMLFKNYAIYPHMNVYENMALGLKLRNVPKERIDQIVRDAAKSLDLEMLLDRKPKVLTAGQRLRVAMGRAIVLKPKVFLMDEPLSNLDAKLRSQVRIEIAKLQKRLGTTTVYVTNDLNEAMALGTRLVVMNAGTTEQIGTPQKLYSEPCNKFVAGFIGTPQMNFLDATCEVEAQKAYLHVGDRKIQLPEGKAKKLVDGNYNGKPVILGIRPEDVHEEPEFSITKKEASFEAKITLYEMMDVDVLLHFEYGGANMIAQVSPKTEARTGDIVRFAMDVEKIHVFDKETGKTITN